MILQETSERDRSVVQGKWLVSFFEDGMYVCFFPVLRDIPYLQWKWEKPLQEWGNFLRCIFQYPGFDLGQWPFDVEII